MDGIFNLTGVLSLAAIGMTLFAVPAEARGAGGPVLGAASGALRETLRNADQLRLNFVIFSLHVVQMAICVVIPAALVRYGGLPVAEHWKIYLPVVIGSFVLMAPPLIHAERRGRLKVLFLSAIVLLLAVELRFAVCYTNFHISVALLLAFFVAFNILEATLPSLVSRIAPPASRGTALGVYNTTQALGLFVGGAVGGWLAGRFGEFAVFVFGIAIVALWLGTAWRIRVSGRAPERTLPVLAGADAAALRGELLRLRGVRDAVIAPQQGVVRLTVYPDSFDADTAKKLIEGKG